MKIRATALLSFLGRAVVAFSPVVLISYGTWQIYEPAGWITLGALLWLEAERLRRAPAPAESAR